MSAPKPAECGTYAGYKSHQRHGETVCDECREAKREYSRQWRADNPDRRPALRSSGRRWTDEEVGFLEANPNMTAYEAGRELGRSEPSVWEMRRKMRDGKVVLASWTEEELDFVRTTPHLTHHQVAKHLDKKPSTVRGARQRLSRVEGIRFDEYGDKSPYHVGARRLLAKTCTKCGLLLEANWFTERKKGRRQWFSACTRCLPRGGESRTPRDVRRARNQKTQQKLQSLSLQHAVNHQQPYTEADHKVLANPDMTVLEKAIAIGRTYFATNNATTTNGYTSKVGLGDPMNGRWVIDNPNVLEMAS